MYSIAYTLVDQSICEVHDNLRICYLFFMLVFEVLIYNFLLTYSSTPMNFLVYKMVGYVLEIEIDDSKLRV